MYKAIKKEGLTMLFGRKKPGFVEVEEIEDENKEENIEDAADETEASSPEDSSTNLLEFLAGLPDAEDEYANLVKEEAAVAEEEKELSESEKLADYIRIRSKVGQLTGYSSLQEEIEEVDVLLEEIKAEEESKDIVYREGKKDKYYYSNEHMSDNYAMITALVEDKDLVATVVKMVRFNAKTYPAPTPLNYFERHPYYMSKPQIERVSSMIVGREEYNDIERFTNNKNVDFLSSTQFITSKYAKALAFEDEFID